MSKIIQFKKPTKTNDLKNIEDFNNKINRIRTSLDKINNLMNDIKKLSEQDKNS